MMARDPYSDYTFRERICAWLRANGIDPARTPMYPDPSIADGQITIRQKVRRPGSNGDVLAPGGTAVLTETITVPLIVDPDDDVAAWVHRPGLDSGL
jgi:hypothetical protein